ncbi:DUF4253 domain-containing protein [Streptomyces sp. NPDC058195]|uniref:DUF4253 domain-containing protein n=1 Tax=Streptomyces sp. NPDC058195 TaxID=3346375 RepID=UPI0036E3E8D8
MHPGPRSVLGTALPPGRMITSDEGDGDEQPLWLSDGPATAGLWARVHAEHAGSGLWPLLLAPLEPDDDGLFRPWGSGEVYPEDVSVPASHDPAALLAKWWAAYTAAGEGDALSEAERVAVTAPFGQDWPGLAPGREATADAGRLASACAEAFLADRPSARLGLVAAASGAEALAAAGWSGPLNYDHDTAKFSAVVRDWEHRFGVRVVGVGFATLHLSVAAPPTTAGEALRVAAEHFAFCPDNVWQSRRPHTLAAYAGRIVGAARWDFWWD